MARQRKGNRERSIEKERDEKKKKEHRPFSELYSWSLALSGSSLITPGCSLKLSGNGLCYTKKGIITLFSSSVSDKHPLRVGARGHIHAHTAACINIHILFPSLLFCHTHTEWAKLCVAASRWVWCSFSHFMPGDSSIISPNAPSPRGEKAVRETSLFLREHGVCNIQLSDNTFTL